MLYFRVLSKQKDNLQKILQAQVVVRRTAHPETEVYIFGEKYHVQKQMRNVTFYYDPENDSVAAK